jgi:serine/threonine kinase PknH
MSDAQGSRVGSKFGPYHLKRLLGRGGMGEVYEAEHTVKEWPCALKLMSDTFSKDPVFRERMKREARIAGRLREPHVVPIHDYGEINGQMFMEMRLIEGTDLDTLLKRFGPLTPPRAVAIISQIASALDAAHAASVMHRDVKPPNILVTRDDFAYLVDFGIANATTDEKLTQLGAAVGTRKYMAPERFTRDEVTYRADIYALACVLHESLTGSPPYRADSEGMLITSHLMDPIPQPSTVRSGIPKGFDEVIARGMAKKAEDRYASAGDLAMAAHEALSDPDQDHAVNILRRSQEATLPAGSKAAPPPTLVGTTPAPTPVAESPTPMSNTPPPSGAQSSPTPYAGAAGAGPSSGPVPQSSPPGPPWGPTSGPIPTPQYYQGSSGNWGGPPPGATPPQQFSGSTPWNQAPAKPKRNPWPIVAAVAALVIIIVLAAIGIWIANSGGDNTGRQKATGASTSTTTTTTLPSSPVTSSPTSPANDAQARLLGMVPAGYPNGACAPSTPKPNTIWSNAVAMVECGPNTNKGGPTHSIFGLYANADMLTKAFNDDIGTMDKVNCPGQTQSPTTWHYNSSQTVNEGMIACGTYKGHSNVAWSTDSKLLLSDVISDSVSVEDLHTWWVNYGG